MNASQKLILKICALIILAMMLFPPFQLMGRGMGYHFVFVGPEYYRQASINGVLLLVQWIGVCLIGGIAYLLAGEEATKDDPGILAKPVVKHSVRLLMWAMRAVRGLALIYAVIGGLGLIVDLMKLTTYDETAAFDAGSVAALLLMKLVGLAAVVGLALALRLVINHIHRRLTGSVSPLLANWRSL